MTDREKLISGLEELKQRLLIQKDICGYGYFVGEINDVLAYLQAQQPAKPDTAGYAILCGGCGEGLDVTDEFCRHCGKAVKWVRN